MIRLIREEVGEKEREKEENTTQEIFSNNKLTSKNKNFKIFLFFIFFPIQNFLPSNQTDHQESAGVQPPRTLAKIDETVSPSVIKSILSLKLGITRKSKQRRSTLYVYKGLFKNLECVRIQIQSINYKVLLYDYSLLNKYMIKSFI